MRQGRHFRVGERVALLTSQSPPVVLLEADSGTGWWRSNTTSERVEMEQPATVCALAATAADAPTAFIRDLQLEIVVRVGIRTLFRRRIR